MKSTLSGAICHPVRSVPFAASVAFGALMGLLAVTGCGKGTECLEGDSCAEGALNTDPSQTDGKGEMVAPACADVGNSHIGLGGDELTEGRTMAAPFTDRSRTKPYSALAAEYARVLGDANKPGAIDQAGGTFGQPQDRWYVEPQASAVLLNTAYTVAFEGCLKMTGDIGGGTADPKYEAAPTAETARTECALWGRTFWSREATTPELDACVAVAMTDSLQEVYPQTDPRQTTPKRRWAYACASVLTSTGFLAY